MATVETGNKDHCVNEAMHVLERLNLELFRNGSVHKFYRLEALITLEQVNTSVVEKKENLNSIVSVANFHCMQMSLVMSMQFIFRDN